MKLILRIKQKKYNKIKRLMPIIHKDKISDIEITYC